ncbi:hypothetical protein CPB83DRAFT_863172 [Crepidotus variabilis]|uniref:Uncharacterized protein n=1 Tax=Crepidotus variabilis TaxID=179855 RepID=A0A9P6E6H5_9AGAR|nr:hypothetical protein CPB83DRAFT_863172 [Crepidotus variabilis]
MFLSKVLARIQQDPASRSAIRAILILFTKYSQSFSEISSAAADAVVDVANEVKEDISSATSDAKTNATSNAEAPKSPKPSKHVYPPTHPYVDPKPLVDITARDVLLDIKDVLERLGGRHSLDGLVESLAQLVRCVNEVPGVLVDEVEELVEEKVGGGEEGGGADEGEDEDVADTSAAPAKDIDIEKEIPVPKPGHPKSRKEKRKEKHQKASEGGGGSASGSGSGSGSERSKSEEYEQPQEVEGKHTENLSDHAHPQRRKNRKKEMNPIREYLIEIGEFFEQSLDENDPGWVLSDEGSEALDRIVADGIELFQVVGEAAIQVGENALSGDEVQNQRPPSREEEIKTRFRTSLHASLVSLDAYISALQHDRSTMRLVSSFSTLHSSFTSLFSVAASQTAQTAAQARNKTLAFGLQSYAIDWIAYMLPKILRMLPSNFIPLPSVEIKSGTLEAGLYGSFVQGLARRRDAEPLRTSLVPDEVVVRHWTEVRVRPNSVDERMKTMSRVSVHMDGVRAKLEDVGYFFKYVVGSGSVGSLVGYEDEGLVSVDFGLGGEGEGVHEGIGVDVELEMQTGGDEQEALMIPKVTVQDADSECGRSKRPITIALPAPTTPKVEDIPPLFRVISTTLHLRSLKFEINRSRHWVINKLVFQPLSGPLVSTLVEKALQEKVRSGLEALGRALGLLAREAEKKGVERHVETGRWQQQDTWTDTFGDWYKALVESGPKAFGYEAAVESADSEDGDADQTGEDEPQTTTTTGLHPTAKGVIWSSTTTVDPSAGDEAREQSHQNDEEGDTEDECPTPKASQPQGHPPMVYKKSTASMERVDMDAVKELEGVLNGNGHGSIDSKQHSNNNGAGPEDSADEHQDHNTEESEPEVVAETLVAIGAQPQLFPSKGGIDGYAGYSSTSTTERFDDEAAAERQALLDDVEQGIETAVHGVKKGKAKLDDAGNKVGEAGKKAQGAERRFEERVEVEERLKTRSGKGWRSDAFDF